jgi:hypothetical protein
MDEAETRSIGLQFVIDPNAPADLQIVAIGIGGAGTRTPMGSRSVKAGSVPFAVSVTESSAKIVVGEVSRTFDANNFRPGKVALSCSTGEFKLTSLSLTQ